MSQPGRGSVWRRLGPPTEQIGSVNDPRTHAEHGTRWNEKWIYRDPDRAGYDRVVLWYRYDLKGAFRVHANGHGEPEAEPIA